MAESEISYFEFLKNFIDIRRMAFSTRGTRLVLLENDEGVLIRQSERPGKAMTERGGIQIKTPILEGLTFTDGKGKPLSMQVTTYRKVIHNQAEQQSDGSWQVELVMAEGKNGALIFNFTPRLGFNRYIPNISNSFYLPPQRWIAWC